MDTENNEVPFCHIRLFFVGRYECLMKRILNLASHANIVPELRSVEVVREFASLASIAPGMGSFEIISELATLGTSCQKWGLFTRCVR